MSLTDEEKNRVIQCLEFDTEDLKVVINDFERDSNIPLKSPRNLKYLLELTQKCINKLKQEWRLK